MRCLPTFKLITFNYSCLLLNAVLEFASFKDTEGFEFAVLYTWNNMLQLRSYAIVAKLDFPWKASIIPYGCVGV